MLLKAVNRHNTDGFWSNEAEPAVPSRVTGGTETRSVPILGMGISLDTETPPEVVIDKSLYKAKEVCGIPNANIIPDGLRNLDTDASWSTSKYRGWVYGYGLHLTTTASGFPRLAKVYTASISEKAVLDQKIEALIERNIRYIAADAGYTDLNRVKRLADKGVLL